MITKLYWKDTDVLDLRFILCFKCIHVYQFKDIWNMVDTIYIHNKKCCEDETTCNFKTQHACIDYTMRKGVPNV